MAKGVVSIVRDISNQKKAERQIEDNYKEKEVLLEEIHHRVKNNLALISSLLYLQMEKATNEQVKENLKMAYSRLQSIALVHEKSYQQAEADAIINLNTYLPKLISSIEQTIKVPNKDIDTYIDASHISIPLSRAIPSGLLVSELIINAYKHAFKERNKGHIKINASFMNDQINIRIKDNGVGLPEDFSLNSETLGMSIVQALKNQLDGELTFSSNADQGTTFSLSFAK